MSVITARPVFRPKLTFLLALALGSLVEPAAASTSYDGSWNLLFVSHYGPCDPSYNLTVDIRDGVLSNSLARFTGRVAGSGVVRASVMAGDLSALGSGKLSSATGRGGWKGRSGALTCGGNWTAQRN